MILAIKRKLVFFCFILCFCFPLQSLQLAQPSKSPSKLELISKYNGFSKEGGGIIGLWIRLEPGWHTYWQNPGDTGLPPTFNWKKPKELRIKNILWPTPQKIVQEGIVTFGYEKETLILFPINISSKKVTVENLNLKLEVQYLVCREICLTFSTNLSISLKVEKMLETTSFSNLFLKYEKKLPSNGDKWIKEVKIKENNLEMVLSPHLLQFFGINEIERQQQIDFDFFPKEQGVFNLNKINMAKQFSNIIITLPLATDVNKIKKISGVLGGKNIDGDINARSLNLSFRIKSSKWTDLLLSLLYAFLGGIILNIMPCVFPVLSMKVMSIISMSGDDDRRGRLKHGLLFSFGVILTFCLLALIILILKQSGIALGWGFHLQSPIFVVLLLFLFIALSLNLLGWYEMGLPIASFFGRKMGKEMGSFSSGIVSTLVATPCTAPFMGTAVGYSLAKGGLHTIAIFTALGIGMAFPFFLLCIVPKANKYLPKPGSWMETFKHVMAFPLLGTTLWLYWLWQRQIKGFSSNQMPLIQTESDRGVLLLICVLIFSFALWLYGQSVQLSRQKIYRILSSIAVILLLTFSLKTAIKLSNGHNKGDKTNIKKDKASLTFNNNEQSVLGKNSLAWEEFDQKKLNQYISENHPILIDFTADWCITCQVNKKMTFDSKAIKGN